MTVKILRKNLRLLTIVSLCFASKFLIGQAEFTIKEGQSGKMLEVTFSDASIDKSLRSKETITAQKLLQVYVGPMDRILKGVTVPPVLGRYKASPGKIVFRPRFSFQEGLVYTAVFDKRHMYEFQIPKPKTHEPPYLTAIYPSADTLPENQLKFYLHFSQPMTEGRAYESVFITAQNNDTLANPFVELHPELWDVDRQRLTLWLDPGRIKRALGPNELLGTPLVAGRHYTLHISGKWEDAYGNALKEPTQKKFFVKTADRLKPDLDQWAVIQPVKAGTHEPLIIHFGEPLDHALLLRSITVWKDTEQIAGEIAISKGEKHWQFKPTNPWKMGEHKLRVEAKLEDLAGNNLNRLFDRDLQKGSGSTPEKQFYWLELE